MTAPSLLVPSATAVSGASEPYQHCALTQRGTCTPPQRTSPRTACRTQPSTVQSVIRRETRRTTAPNHVPRAAPASRSCSPPAACRSTAHVSLHHPVPSDVTQSWTYVGNTATAPMYMNPPATNGITCQSSAPPGQRSARATELETAHEIRELHRRPEDASGRLPDRARQVRHRAFRFRPRGQVPDADAHERAAQRPSVSQWAGGVTADSDTYPT
ncbi:hypothetical protein BD413DRAFT_140551 [Trametes elegans]|nr:hypothetical protein BD413DRAFT_140551 [Trametes elegans]